MRARLSLVLVALILGLFLAPARILANAGPPPPPQKAGDSFQEPLPRVQSVAIERETLTIDLRPVANGQPAIVDVTYVVRNDGPDQRIDLLFVAAALAGSEANVSLDGQPVPSAIANVGQLPASWQPPKTTPRLGDGGELPYAVQTGRDLRFAVTLTPGQHTIRVRYLAQLSAYSSGDSPTRYWQLGYVLAPARQWAGFGGLDISVHLPEGWLAASQPRLERNGDVLSGSFREIPSDSLALTVQAPPPMVVQPGVVVGAIGLVAALALGAFVGRWLAHRRQRAWGALPVALLMAFVWAIAMLVAGLQDSLGAIPPSQESWVYTYNERSYGRFVGALLLAPLFFLVGLVVTQLSAFIAFRLGGEAQALSSEVQAPAGAGYAGFWRRAGSFLIDLVLFGIASSIVGMGLSLVDAAEWVQVVVPVVIAWVYWATMESSSRQGTLGKIALGIAVTSRHGKRISFGRATARFFARGISALILFAGFVMVELTERKQALHDIIAGCLVVRKWDNRNTDVP